MVPPGYPVPTRYSPGHVTRYRPGAVIGVELLGMCLDIALGHLTGVV
jgi:hypothetical protein